MYLTEVNDIIQGCNESTKYMPKVEAEKEIREVEEKRNFLFNRRLRDTWFVYAICNYIQTGYYPGKVPDFLKK
jgi:hypothetical protein